MNYMEDDLLKVSKEEVALSKLKGIEDLKFDKIKSMRCSLMEKSTLRGKELVMGCAIIDDEGNVFSADAKEFSMTKNGLFVQFKGD